MKYIPTKIMFFFFSEKPLYTWMAGLEVQGIAPPKKEGEVENWGAPQVHGRGALFVRQIGRLTDWWTCLFWCQGMLQRQPTRRKTDCREPWRSSSPTSFAGLQRARAKVELPENHVGESGCFRCAPPRRQPWRCRMHVAKKKNSINAAMRRWRRWRWLLRG